MPNSPLEVSLAMDALRIPHEDALSFEQYLFAATSAVYRYLSWDDDAYAAALENDQEAVKTAILILAGHFYRSPDIDEAGAFSHGHLPWIVTAPLYQLRDPALA